MATMTAAGCGTPADDIPNEQQAIVQAQNGGPAVLSLQTVPVLEPGDGQVLVRVRAAAINPIDWKIREGYTPFPTHEPRIPGFDIAGDVVKVGAGVDDLKPGDAVFSMIGMLDAGGLNGGYSEYAVAPAANTLPMPEGYSYPEAAGLGTVGIAAARLMHKAQVAEGERVFVNGIAGGVGSSVAQMAKAAGATVIGTASARHHDYLDTLDVDQVVNYRETDFIEVVDPVDVYVETVKPDLATRGLAIVKRGGRMVSVVGVPDAAACADADVTCTAVGGPPKSDELTEAEYLGQVAALAKKSQFRIQVDQEYPLAEAAAAQEENRDGGTQGKLVLIVGGN